MGNLGESEHNFRIWWNWEVFYSEKIFRLWSKTDTIVCSVNLESRPLASIGYSLNGKRLGSARHFGAGPRGLGVLDTSPSKLPWESALFRSPWSFALGDGHAITGASFLTPEGCEVMTRVGLPASGKTTWAEKRVKDHPEKRDVLMGANLTPEQMRVPASLHKQNYGERSNCLMDRAT